MPQPPDRSARYGFGPAVQLAVGGSRRARRHFEREYGPPTRAGGRPQVGAELTLWGPPPAGAAAGGHKTARWWVRLGEPAARPLRVDVTLAGGPTSFALSLVQGYYVEPLVAIALAEAGFVALPSAALVSDGRAVVLMGHSGSGKSSVSVRALAGGRRILGDDQVVIGADGGCWPYRRRLRLYPDVEETAPGAWARLEPSTRRALRLRRRLRDASRGYVAPSLPVPVSEVGAVAPPTRLPAERLVLVERAREVAALSERERDAGWAVERAVEVIAAQRSRFAAAAGERWRAVLAETVRQERATLAAWLESVPVTELQVPRAWDAPAAVAALADRLGAGSPV